MKVSALVVTVCLLPTVLFAQGWIKPYEDTTLATDRLEIRFHKWGEAILVDNVMVNGKGPFRFMLDTGAEGAGRLDTTLVKKLKLASVGSDTSVGILGKKREMDRHRLESLTIGDLSFTGVEMISRDYNADRPSRVKPIDGILGYHLFKDYLLTISYPQRMITVERGALPPADGAKVLKVVSDDYDPEIEVRVGDRTMKALFDTGAMSEFAIPESMAQGLAFTGDSKKLGNRIRRTTLDGVLHIGDVEIANPRTIIADGLSESNVGIQIIFSLAVTFDQKNGRIRVERAPEAPKYGIKFSMSSSGPWRFDGVSAGGAAEQAGLRETDRIVAINDRPFQTLDREDLDRVLDGSPITLEIEREGGRQKVRIEPN